MNWTSYPQTGNSVPINVGADIVTVTSNVTSGLGSITLSVMDAGTGVFVDHGTVLFDGPQSVSCLAWDGASSVYVEYRDIYPRTWLSYWTVGSWAFTANNIGILWNCNGLAVDAGAGIAVATGCNHANDAEVENWFLPSTPLASNTYPPSTALGFCVFHAGSVWAPELGTTNLHKFDPTTITDTVFTMPAAADTTNWQIGFDGSFLYISAQGGGIIIWDTTAGTGSLVGTVTTGPCYHSANLGAIVVGDSVGPNMYTMPPGGGALTLIGDLDTITSTPSPPCVATGFCDGPGGLIWANAHDQAPPNNFFNVVNRGKSGDPMRLLL